MSANGNTDDHCAWICRELAESRQFPCFRPHKRFQPLFRSDQAPEGSIPLTTLEHIDWTNVLIAAPLAAGISFGAWRLNSLTTTGAFAAGFLGLITVAGAGWVAGLLMVAFFVSSSALSRLSRIRDDHQISQRGSRRDAVQVLANGGVPGLIALVALLNPVLLDVALAGIAGGLAAATADTWATEIGRRARGQPRNIITGNVVTAGVSGGVTPMGTAASLAGAAFIALLAQFIIPLFGNGTGLIAGLTGLLAITVAGFGGALVDSLAGATIQARYFCDSCQIVTESPIHECGQRARLVAGYPFVTNDVVNMIASTSGAAIALAIALLAS